MHVGDRVKRVRRGCKPCYGTIVSVHSVDEMDGVTWFHVDWDHSGVSLANSRQIKAVKVDRSWKAKYGK